MVYIGFDVGGTGVQVGIVDKEGHILCKGGIVTVEDHQIIGGLGSAVAEAMAEAGVGAKLLRVGLNSFGESGTPEELYRHFGLDGAGIEKSVRKFLGK